MKVSFSSIVKAELSRQISEARHCRIAEVAALISFCGRIGRTRDNRYSITIQTEHEAVARKCFTLIKKTFNISTNISIRENTQLKKNNTYLVSIPEHEDAVRVLKAVKLFQAVGAAEGGSSSWRGGKAEEDIPPVGNVVMQQRCCKRAFIRGAYLAAGSISAPEKFYHFEVVCATETKAKQLQGLIASFDLDAKIVLRKKYFVVYIKEGSQIADILKVMEAPVALMELENIRILKEMRNHVNRKVNCETANISKTVSAAVKQIEDITYIRDTIGFEGLPENLEEIANLRLQMPEATLTELGVALPSPVGKSGVNHRLRKLSSMAEWLREGNADAVTEQNRSKDSIADGMQNRF